MRKAKVIDPIREPGIHFLDWRRWSIRGTTRQEDPFDDPPSDFDVPGVYLLAQFKANMQMKKNVDGFLHLNPHVLYIGLSTRVTHRLEGAKHEKIRSAIKDGTVDLKNLYFSICHPEWHPVSPENKDMVRVRKTWLHWVERKLIWEYAKTFKRIPILNRY